MALSGPGCTLLPCEPIEARIRSVFIIVVMAACGYLPRMALAPEQMFVQALISQPNIERFKQAVLHRFTRRDVVSLDAALLLPSTRASDTKFRDQR